MMKTILKSLALAAFGLMLATGCSSTSTTKAACPADCAKACCAPAPAASNVDCPPGCVHPCASELVSRLPECDCK